MDCVYVVHGSGFFFFCLMPLLDLVSAFRSWLDLVCAFAFWNGSDLCVSFSEEWSVRFLLKWTWFFAFAT